MAKVQPSNPLDLLSFVENMAKAIFMPKYSKTGNIFSQQTLLYPQFLLLHRNSVFVHNRFLNMALKEKNMAITGVIISLCFVNFKVFLYTLFRILLMSALNILHSRRATLLSETPLTIASFSKSDLSHISLSSSQDVIKRMLDLHSNSFLRICI